MSRTLRALIVDDEPLARDRIRMLLEDVSDVAVAGEFHDGPSAVEGIRQLRPDLVFLDVQMPEMDGFGVIKAVGPERMPATVFVTAYDQYALRAFDVSAADYLLKPFDRERFMRALARARKHAPEFAAGLHARLLSLFEQTTSGAYSERLVIKSAGRISFVKADEVDWIEAAGNYVRLHVARETHMLRETMNAVEGMLDPRKFARIHRSAMVNIERIKELQPSFHGDHQVTLRDGSRLTLSRSYRGYLERALGRTL